MNRLVSALIVTAGLGLACGPASAAETYLDGHVCRIVNSGVYIQNTSGVTFVPSAHTNFRSGDSVIPITQMAIGKEVNVYYSPGFAPEYLPVDYYNSHKDWDWDHFRSDWKVENKYWVKDGGGEGHWHRTSDN